MKHNVFLGSGSGSIGDVVSYRREGTQVSRMRVREIKNPRTYNQAEQRNFLAPVSKFYAPLAGALEQSWEGKSTAKSYAAFSSAAVKKARLNGWFLPKGTGFYPLPYQLSQGTIAPLSYELVSSQGTTKISIPLDVNISAESAGSTLGAFSKAMIENGYKDGDQITVIMVTKNPDAPFVPTYSRFYLDSASEVNFEDATGLRLTALAAGDSQINIGVSSYAKGVAIIASRYENEKWRRSTQSLLVNDDVLTAVTSEEAKENAIASYMNGQYVPVSEIYLNGSTQQ